MGTYKLKIYNEDNLYLDCIYKNHRMDAAKINDDNLLDTIFSDDFSFERILEFLKTRIHPDIHSDNIVSLFNELIKTGGKKRCEDNILITVTES